MTCGLLPNRKPIFAIIGHWITPDFEEREEVLELIEIQGSHTGEALALVVERLLVEFKLQGKLFTITGDNASNNGTLCNALFQSLCKEYSDMGSLSKKPMHFHGKDSWIRCLAHVIALICGDVLGGLKAGTAKEAKKLLDNWDKDFSDRNYIIPMDESRSCIAKIRLLNLWILRSSQREQAWALMPRTRNRRPIYDVDTRWNSLYDMIVQYIDLLAEYKDFINSHSQVAALALSMNEELSLHQLAKVLKPFKVMTLHVSETMPEVGRSLEIYWDLDNLLDQVTNGVGSYAELDQSLRDAFATGRKKYIKYSKKLEKNALLFAAHILDPRYRSEMIKDMMADQKDEVIQAAIEYLCKEWPALLEVDTQEADPFVDDPIISVCPSVRPATMSLAVFRSLEKKKEAAAAVNEALPTKQLLRWIELEPVAWSDDPEFCRRWWKDNWRDWKLIAPAARAMLACSASEVDVERLFSGCKDEIGIRRHSLKADTVRVLTLLRSNYTSEDEVDQRLLEEAMKLDVWQRKNSILWRPDEINELLVDSAGMVIYSFFAYALLTCCRFISNSMRSYTITPSCHIEELRLNQSIITVTQLIPYKLECSSANIRLKF